MSNVNKGKLALLLMAAGSSSRLGQPKQLLEVVTAKDTTQSLLHKQVILMNSVCSSFNAQAYCVVGFKSEVMITHLATCPSAQKLTLIENTQWSEGLSTSIAKGVSTLTHDVSAVLVFLVDQWQLSTQHLATLIKQWQMQPDKIHMASYNNEFGPPTIFPRAFFNELIALNGDDGAKKVIKNNKEKVNSIEMPSVFIDVDTPEQLKNLHQIK